MGVNLRDLLDRKPLTLDELAHKPLIVDGNNALYQFLSTIRARDGSLFTDSNGNVTSHLIGLLSRTTKLAQKNIKLAFVFDGKPPQLKHKELQERKARKQEAAKKYEEALEAEDIEAMQKYGARTSRLTPAMIAEAEKLLTALGIPTVHAPSEGEAQAAHMVSQGHGWAVASQDYDSLLYGTPRLVQNLSVEGRRKAPGKHAYTSTQPTLIALRENLDKLDISREKLIWLAMLIGTDYAPSGVKGIGPKKGLELVKKHDTAESLFSSVELVDDVDWRDILDVFHTMPVIDDYDLTWRPVNRSAVATLLVDEHDFSPERVEKTLDAITPHKEQKGLGDFT